MRTPRSAIRRAIGGLDTRISLLEPQGFPMCQDPQGLIRRFCLACCPFSPGQAGIPPSRQTVLTVGRGFTGSTATLLAFLPSILDYTLQAGRPLDSPLSFQGPQWPRGSALCCHLHPTPIQTIYEGAKRVSLSRAPEPSNALRDPLPLLCLEVTPPSFPT